MWPAVTLNHVMWPIRKQWGGPQWDIGGEWGGGSAAAEQLSSTRRCRVWTDTQHYCIMGNMPEVPLYILCLSLSHCHCLRLLLLDLDHYPTGSTQLKTPNCGYKGMNMVGNDTDCDDWSVLRGQERPPTHTITSPPPRGLLTSGRLSPWIHAVDSRLWPDHQLPQQDPDPSDQDTVFQSSMVHCSLRSLFLSDRTRTWPALLFY